MKKNVLLASIILFIMSCTSDGSFDVTKHCWTFNLKTTVNMGGQSSTATGTSTKCDLTESEANDYMKQFNNTTTSSSGGYTMTSTTTCTSKQKND